MRDDNRNPDPDAQETGVRVLAEALASGLSYRMASLFAGHGSAVVERVEKGELPAALQALGGSVNALEVNFHAGIEGPALVLMRKPDFIRLGRGILGRGAAEGETLTPDVMEAGVALFAGGIEAAGSLPARDRAITFSADDPELINPEGNHEGILPLGAAYGDSRCIHLKVSWEPSRDLDVRVVLAQQTLKSLAGLAAARAASRAAQAPSQQEARPDPRVEPLPAGGPASPQWNMDLILDVELGVVINFGETQMPLRDILKLGVGSVIELDKGVNDPVMIMVNDKPIASGEVVMVDGNYGVKVLEVESTVERIRSLA